MTTTEFWLAWLFNLRGVAGGIAVLISITGVALVAVWFFTLDALDRAEARVHSKIPRVAPWLVCALVVSVGLASVPGPDDLWKLRVGLLKLDLASPENVQKVGGHVEEIVKALECKHLQVNCPVPEK